MTIEAEVEAPPAPPKKHNRIWLYGPWTLFIVLAVAWCAHWFIVADAVEKRIALWAAAQEQAGGRAQIGAITRHGFPAMLRFELDTVSYAPVSRAFELETPSITLHVNMLDPRNLYLERKARFNFIRGIDRSTLDANTAVLSLTLGDNGITYAGLEADRVTIDNLHAEGRVTLDHIIANARPDPRNNSDWQIALALDALHVARPITAFELLGQDLPRVEAAIVWTAQQRARIEGSSLEWGAAHASVLGEIGLDAAHRLAGQMNISAPRSALDVLPDGLRLIAQARQPEQTPLTLTLHAETGALSAGGVEIRSLAPLY